jgi:hypothetical protein
VGGKALSCHKEGYRITGRAKEKTEKRKRKANRTDQKNQHDVPTRAGNFACLIPAISLPQKGLDGPPEGRQSTTHAK